MPHFKSILGTLSISRSGSSFPDFTGVLSVVPVSPHHLESAPEAGGHVQRAATGPGVLLFCPPGHPGPVPILFRPETGPSRTKHHHNQPADQVGRTQDYLADRDSYEVRAKSR